MLCDFRKVLSSCDEDVSVVFMDKAPNTVEDTTCASWIDDEQDIGSQSTFIKLV